MEIDLIFKIAAVGIIVSILNQVLSRSGREEQATMTTLTGLVVVLMMVAQKISDAVVLVLKFLGNAQILKLLGEPVLHAVTVILNYYFSLFRAGQQPNLGSQFLGF